MAFAAAADVAARMGRALTDQETQIATDVIAAVTGMITDAVDRDSAWAADLDPVPTTLSELCIQKAIGAIANPKSVAVQSETIGGHSRSVTYPRMADIGVFLSDAEERRARMAVYGSNAASASAESVVDRLMDLREGRNVDEDPPA